MPNKAAGLLAFPLLCGDTLGSTLDQGDPIPPRHPANARPVGRVLCGTQRKKRAKHSNGFTFRQNNVSFGHSLRWIPALVAAEGPLLDQDDGRYRIALNPR